ncbi:hypothetical protein V8D89_003175 [Ganoderma adspersum]
MGRRSWRRRMDVVIVHVAPVILSADEQPITGAILPSPPSPIVCNPPCTHKAFLNHVALSFPTHRSNQDSSLGSLCQLASPSRLPQIVTIC